MPAATSHGTVSAAASSSRPANSGPNTDGPRIAPKTLPKSTYEIPRARRCGRVHVTRRGADQQRDPVRGAGQREPGITAGVESMFVASAVSEQPAGRQQIAARDHRPAPDAIHQPPGGHRGQPGRDEEDRRPQPEQPFDARDEHERDRGDRRDELQHGRVDGHRRRQQQRVAADGDVRERRAHAPPRRGAARTRAGAARPRRRDEAAGGRDEAAGGRDEAAGGRGNGRGRARRGGTRRAARVRQACLAWPDEPGAPRRRRVSRDRCGIRNAADSPGRLRVAVRVGRALGGDQQHAVEARRTHAAPPVRAQLVQRGERRGTRSRRSPARARPARASRRASPRPRP